MDKLIPLDRLSNMSEVSSDTLRMQVSVRKEIAQNLTDAQSRARLFKEADIILDWLLGRG